MESIKSEKETQQQTENATNIENQKINIFKKLWSFRRYFIIEPFVFCWILSSCVMMISIQNLGLEKACRFKLGYPKHVCDNVIDKALNGIDCDEFKLSDVDNSTINPLNINITELHSMILNNLTTPSITSINNDGNNNPSTLSYNFNYTVCIVERETQKQVTFINGIRGPIASIFPIIVILFAGGWSDKNGLRKPCMIFPMIGEFLSATALLISSIFMESIPMEFGNILEKVLPAMLGGYTLMLMGIYSYLTVSTQEEDRTFRFGIFAVFASTIQILGSPFSGTLFKYLGYFYVFLLGDILLVLGILYLIFFVDELKTPIQSTTLIDGQENPAFELTETENSVQKPPAKYSNSTRNETIKKNCLIEFFDPTLAFDCIKVFLKKRERNGRQYLILLVCSYFLFVGPALSESEYAYQFSLIALNWNGEQFSVYNAFSTVITPIGTFLMTGVFGKIFHITDSMIGLISSTCTVISRPFFAFSKTAPLFYVATTIDMFLSTKVIAIKAVISRYVETEELGRIYSVMGIADAFGGFIFPPIYSYIYSSTIDTFAGAFFLFGELFFIPNALIFALTYFLIRNKSSQTATDQTSKVNEESGGENTTTNGKEVMESTYV